MQNNKNSQTNLQAKGPGMGMGRGMRGGEKAKDFKKSIGKLLRYMKPYHASILLALLFAIGGTVIAIVCPKLLGNITNEVQNVLSPLAIPINLPKIATIGFLLAGLYLLSTALNIIQGFIMNSVTQNLSKKLRSDISHKINLLPLKYFDARSYGDVLSRVTNDVDTLSQSLNQSVSSIISAVTMLIGSIIMMFVIKWQIAIVLLIIMPLSGLLMMVIMKFSQRYFRMQQASLGMINGHIEEIYAGHQVVKVYNASDRYLSDFQAMNQTLYTSAWKSQFISGIMQPLMNFVGNLSYVIVCILGGIYAAQQTLKIGDIQSLIIYIRLFTQPLGQIAQASTNMQSAAAAAERIFEFLEAEEMSNESAMSERLVDVQGKVEFQHVKFGYDKNNPIIHDFSATALPGQKIAIVGPTGAGKTTMVNLLMKFYEIDAGDILIDNVSINKLTRENVHDIFGMVLQDTWLFKGTIFENLIYSNDAATADQVYEACKAANIDHFIQSLPGGYQMVLDEESNISQGQKQLLTIARAMIEDAPLLILDEATSSVDTRTEILIQEAMDRLMAGRTSFVIAHRLSTIKNADLILVMRDGDIVEMGNHETLITKKGFYADLYNSQFEKVLDEA